MFLARKNIIEQKNNSTIRTFSQLTSQNFEKPTNSKKLPAQIKQFLKKIFIPTPG